MDLPWYDKYEELLAEGRRAEAKEVLRKFLKRFGGFEDREQWTRAFLSRHAFGQKIRHEVYSELIFPVIFEGSKSKDAWSLFWLGGTSQNLYSARRLHAQVGFKTELQFLRIAYEADASSTRIRSALLRSLLDSFGHAAHEWPAGILWGMDGATPEQCKMLLCDVALARELNQGHLSAASIDDFEHKVLSYLARSEPSG